MSQRNAGGGKNVGNSAQASSTPRASDAVRRAAARSTRGAFKRANSDRHSQPGARRSPIDSLPAQQRSQPQSAAVAAAATTASATAAAATTTAACTSEKPAHHAARNATRNVRLVHVRSKETKPGQTGKPETASLAPPPQRLTAALLGSHMPIPKTTSCDSSSSGSTASPAETPRKVAAVAAAAAHRRNKRKPRSSRERWESMFALLKRYIQQHNTARVPQRLRDPQFRGLGLWVARQRSAYRETAQNIAETRRAHTTALGLRESVAAVREREHAGLHVPAYMKAAVAAAKTAVAKAQHDAATRRRTPRKRALDLSQIRRLEDVGFEWVLRRPSTGSATNSPIAPMISEGFLRAGKGVLTLKYKGHTWSIDVGEDGSLSCAALGSKLFYHPSTLSVALKRTHNSRVATDSGWNSLTYDGQKLVDVRDAWERQQRQQQQQYVRQTQIQQEGASALGFIDAAAAESGGLHLRGGGGDTAKNADHGSTQPQQEEQKLINDRIRAELRKTQSGSPSGRHPSSLTVLEAVTQAWSQLKSRHNHGRRPLRSISSSSDERDISLSADSESLSS